MVRPQPKFPACPHTHGSLQLFPVARRRFRLETQMVLDGTVDQGMVLRFDGSQMVADFGVVACEPGAGTQPMKASLTPPPQRHAAYGRGLTHIAPLPLRLPLSSLRADQLCLARAGRCHGGARTVHTHLRS